MDNEQGRNEHFKGFAELLLNDLKPDMTALFIALGSPPSSRDVDIMWAERLIKIKLAQRAYDLVYHAFMTASTVTLEDANLRVVDEEDVKDVPDLTEWPNLPQP